MIASMSKDIKTVKKPSVHQRRLIVVILLGAIIMIMVIIATVDISHRNINVFISAQQKYIISVECTILVVFIVEMLAGLTTLHSHTPQMIEHGTRLRLIVRITGYSISSLSVISILASNATLGISVGAITGITIAFAIQNIAGSMLATVFLVSNHRVRIGEEITVSQTKGIVSDIKLTHTILSIGDDVVFIPNSLVMSSIVRRKKRNLDKDISVHDW